MPHDYYHAHSCNADAKLVFVDTYTIITDMADSHIPDGIYVGKLDGTDYDHAKYKENVRYASDPEIFDDCLNYFCGPTAGKEFGYPTSRKSFGYYCVGIKDSKPIAAYLSITPLVYDRAEDLIGSYEHGTPFTGMCRTKKSQGVYLLGGYPYECFEDQDDIPAYGTSLPVYRTCSAPRPAERATYHEWELLIVIYIFLCLLYGTYKGLSTGLTILISLTKRLISLTHRKER